MGERHQEKEEHHKQKQAGKKVLRGLGRYLKGVANLVTTVATHSHMTGHRVKFYTP